MRRVPVLVVGCLLLALSGCVADARGTPPTPNSATASTGATPSSPFASRDEALAAAVAAFQRYVDVDTAIASSPDTDLNRIDEVARGQAAEQERSDVQASRDEGKTQSGAITFDNARLEYLETDADGTVRVHTFICVDFSGKRSLARDGTDVTPSKRDDRVELRVEFASRTPHATDLLVEGTELWSYDGAC